MKGGCCNGFPEAGEARILARELSPHGTDKLPVEASGKLVIKSQIL